MKPIARRELARLGGVTQSVITKATQPGGPLADAVLTRGRGLDLDHPKVRAWLKRRHAATTLPQDGSESERTAPTSGAPGAARVAPPGASEAGDVSGDWQSLTLDEVATMPIEALVRRFGHLDDLKGWLDAAKKAADTRAVDLKNREAEGHVISRELVRVHVFGAMEASHVRLLGDAPKSITRRVYAMAKADEPIEQAERVVRDMIGSHLKPAMAAASKAVPA